MSLFAANAKPTNDTDLSKANRTPQMQENRAHVAIICRFHAVSKFPNLSVIFLTCCKHNLANPDLRSNFIVA